MARLRRSKTKGIAFSNDAFRVPDIYLGF